MSNMPSKDPFAPGNFAPQGNPPPYQQPFPPAQQPPYGAPYAPQQGQPPWEPPQQSNSNGCLWAAVIVGIILLVCVLICAGVAYYVTKNIKSLAVNFARQVAVQAIEGSELTAEDKQQVIGQIDRVVDAYKKGEIDEKDLENILTEVSQSPLLPLAMVYGLEQQYLNKSGLTEQEKADARKQLQRLIRGAMEDAEGGGKKIPQDKIEILMQPLQQTGPNGEKELKPTLTDQEIKTFIAGARKLADEAMIPDEEFKIDIGDEVKRIVDKGLAKKKP